MEEMAEITSGLEANGIPVDPEAIRRAVVNENMPKHMTLIEKEMNEELKFEKETAYFNLQ